MKIYSVDNTVFNSNKSAKVFQMCRLSKNKKFSDVKPIKNYSQYMKEYGIGQPKKETLVSKGQIKKDTI